MPLSLLTKSQQTIYTCKVLESYVEYFQTKVFFGYICILGCLHSLQLVLVSLKHHLHFPLLD